MKSYIYKVIIASIAIIFVFKFINIKEISQINEKINFFSTPEGRKQIIASVKKELRKAMKRKLS